MKFDVFILLIPAFAFLLVMTFLMALIWDARDREPKQIASTEVSLQQQPAPPTAIDTKVIEPEPEPAPTSASPPPPEHTKVPELPAPTPIEEGPEEVSIPHLADEVAVWLANLWVVPITHDDLATDAERVNASQFDNLLIVDDRFVIGGQFRGDLDEHTRDRFMNLQAEFAHCLNRLQKTHPGMSIADLMEVQQFQQLNEDLRAHRKEMQERGVQFSYTTLPMSLETYNRVIGE